MNLRNSLSLLSHGINAMCAMPVVYSAEPWFISYAQHVLKPVVHITEIAAHKPTQTPQGIRAAELIYYSLSGCFW